MKKPLRILHLEDQPDYSDLVQSLLSQEVPAQVTAVSNRKQYEQALAQGSYDLILADYLLPDFDGLSALQLAREKCPETPFLMLSGTLTESAAIEMLARGATDYVLKALPERLLPAVKRALREAAERNARRRIETELRQNERHFRTFTENALDILAITSVTGETLYTSPSLKTVLGLEAGQVAGRNLLRSVHPEDRRLVFRCVRNAVLGSEGAARFEIRVRHVDGRWRVLETVAQNHLSDPEIQGIVFTAHDVTDRRRAEKELRESEQQYRLIFDGNPNPMWVTDDETLAFLEVNDAAIQHYGYSREEFLGMTLRDLRPPGEDPSPLEYIHKLIEGSPNGRLCLAGVWRHLKKGGGAIDVEVKWAPVDFKGRNGFLSLINDVTDRKRVEKRDAALLKLGQSLNATSQIIEAAHIVRSITDELFKWDAFTLNLFIAEKNELVPVLNIDTDREGRRFEIKNEGSIMVPGALSRKTTAGEPQLILRSEPLERDGSSIAIGDKTRTSASLMLVPIRNRTKVMGILSIQSYKLRAYEPDDLQTLQSLADHCGGAIERIRAEQGLRESEMRFRDLFAGSPDAIFVEDLSGKVLDVNLAACNLHSATRAELVGMHVSDLVPASERDQVMKAFARMVSDQQFQIEGFSLTKEGREIPVEVRGNQINYAGKPALLLHVRDISERKRAEEALRGSEMLFHSVWDNSVDGMRLTDRHGVVVAVNDAFCRVVNMSREQLEGKPFTAPYALSENHERQLRRYQERFAARIVERQVERTLTLRNGAVVVLEDTSSFVEQKGREPLLLSLFRDVTAQRKLQEQLRQSQKMEAIGLLAGGVAHDFNNILTVIHGHASLLAADSSLDRVSGRSAQQIIQAADRAAGLTRQLLTFGRRQMMQPRRLDMNDLVTNLTKMLGRILGEDIALKLQYSKEPAVVLADAGMVEQVILNLAVNSRDAMPKGGALFLKISIQEVDARQILEHPEAQPGKFVCLTAMDSGCGIPREYLKRIFEPFFTTKPIGKGTGLGLATAYGIVNQHQGWIEVDSAPNQGAEFRIYLPLRCESVDGAEETNPQSALRGGHETILVVEDEEPVRELVSNVLIAQGYRILKADSGPKAIEIWKTAKNQIDLLLTDLVMPEQMNGRELAEKLLAERPDLKVIFTSGYSAEVVGRDFTAVNGPGFLQKPYQPNRLVRTVRDCLDGAVKLA